MDVLKSEQVPLDLYWSLLEMATDGVWRWDVEKDRVDWSPTLLRTLRYPEWSRGIQDILELTHPEERAIHAAAIDEHVRSGGAYRVEVRLRTYEGNYLWIESRGISLRDDAGRSRVMFGFVVDISESRVRTEAVRLSDLRFRAFMDNCPAAVFLKDEDGKHLYVNPAAAELAGVRPEDMIGRLHREIFPPKTAEELDRVDRGVLESGRLERWTGVLHRSDGTDRWIHDVKFPVDLPSGARALGGFGVDLTELRQVQQSAESAHRLESLGRLAGGVAHDFNNMLNVILGYSRMALDGLAEGDPAREFLREVIDAGSRSAAITRQLLAIARQQPVQPATLDLGERVVESARLLRRLIGENIDLRVERGPDLWPVRLDPGQLDQILVNLSVNARDAIPGVGHISITVENKTVEADGDPGGGDGPLGDWVLLSFSDNGSGMDAEVLGSLFEPFFTTKPVGTGTGLGLATVYGIVKQNGGRIEVESQLGAGSTFRISFPREHGQVERPSAIPEPRRPLGGATILMVEDEAALLRLGTRMLEKLGHRVLPAQGPEEALRVAAAHPDTIDLLMTDVVMPGMSGLDLSLQLRSLHPEARTLFVSGYTEDIIADHGIIDRSLIFLEKPFGLEDLEQAVGRALG